MHKRHKVIRAPGSNKYPIIKKGASSTAQPGTGSSQPASARAASGLGVRARLHVGEADGSEQVGDRQGTKGRRYGNTPYLQVRPEGQAAGQDDGHYVEQDSGQDAAQGQ